MKPGSSRLAGFAALPAAALALALLFYPLASGRIHAAGDLGALHLPFKAFYAESLGRGELPLWCPDLFCGFPLLAQGEVGACHPLHLLLYSALPLWLALETEILAVYAFAFAGMLLLLQRLKFGRDAAMFGAAAFAFSPFFLSQYPHQNHLAVLAHLPWLLRAGLPLLNSDCGGEARKHQAGFALLCASAILFGHPPSLWRVGLGAAAVLGYFCLRGGAPARGAVRLAAAAALGLALGAVQWLPTLVYALRPGMGEYPPGFSDQYSLHPLNLMQGFGLFILKNGYVSDPVSGGDGTEFTLGPGVGMLCLSLAGLALFCRERRRAGALLVAALALLAALMLGRWAGAHGLLSSLPLFGGFRCPARYGVLLEFAAVCLAALAVARAGSGVLDRSLVRAVTLAVLLGAVAAHLAARLLFPEAAGGEELWLSLALAAAMCGGFYLATSGGARLAAFLCLCLLEPEFAGARACLLRGSTLPVAEISAAVAARPANSQMPRLYAPWNRGALEGRRNAAGYCSLAPAPELSYLSEADCRFLNVGAAWRDGKLVEVPGALPRVRLSGEGRLLVLRDSPRELEVKVELPASGALLVADRWDPDWRCAVDGVPAKLEHAAGFARLVELTPGRHEISLRYEPLSYRVGAAVSAIALLLMLLLLRRARSADSY